MLRLTNTGMTISGLTYTDYHSMLKHTNPITEMLFGDNIKTQIGDLTQIKQVVHHMKGTNSKSHHRRRRRGGHCQSKKGDFFRLSKWWRKTLLPPLLKVRMRQKQPESRTPVRTKWPRLQVKPKTTLKSLSDHVSIPDPHVPIGG